ncbi:MAG: 2OG-Fe(II) oxygenase, partial [Nitrosomonas sp.]|nr:2OG-Fe(II) oxygenase [Nitrosomonas sp.]
KWKFTDYKEPLYLSASGSMTSMQYYLKKTRIDDALSALMRLLKNDELYITFDIAMAKTGYSVPVHTDNRYKLLALLIYFNDLKSEEGGELLLHKHKSIQDSIYLPRYPGEENTEVVKRLLPKKNLGVIVLNCNSSYHSATPFSSNEPRKFVYIGICKRYTKNLWVSKDSKNFHPDARGFGESKYD